MKNKRRHCLNKEDLLSLVATWNSDPFLIETDEQLNEIWDEIRIYGFHEIEQDTEDYEVACAQLHLDVNFGYPVFESNVFSCKFGGMLE